MCKQLDDVAICFADGTWVDLDPWMDADEICELAEQHGHTIVDVDNIQFVGTSLTNIIRFVEVWDGENMDIIKTLTENHGFSYAATLVEEEKYIPLGTKEEIVDDDLIDQGVPEHVRWHVDTDGYFRDNFETNGTYLQMDSGNYILVTD